MRSFFTLFLFIGVMTCLQANYFASELRIYPNPSSSGNYVIEMTGTQIEVPVQIKVFNMIGQEMLVQRIESARQTIRIVIDLSHLPKGSYVLEFSQGDVKQTHKLSFI
ncbi:MAG: T9SS type A sorting domain-containing protein [Bacteroidota bacterium]